MLAVMSGSSSWILVVLSVTLWGVMIFSSFSSALYIVDWVVFDSLIPEILPLGLLFAYIGCCLDIPNVANLSAASLPMLLACPLVHLRVVFPFRARRRSMASENHSLLLIPVHPWSSQFVRLVVSPLMAYIESETICTFASGTVWSMAWIIAYISPIWFVWFVPGTRRARFRGSFSLKYIPLPAFALIDLLLVHPPSVYIVVISVESVGSRWPGVIVVVSSAVSIRKMSLMVFDSVVFWNIYFVLFRLVLCLGFLFFEPVIVILVVVCMGLWFPFFFKLVYEFVCEVDASVRVFASEVVL